MNTAVFYFSGTGNTKRVADAWLQAMETEGIQADVFRIGEGQMPDLYSYDKIGIFYPVHAFNAPEKVLEFAKRLPTFQKSTAFYIIMVSGEPLRLNYSSDQKLRRILKNKNAEIESEWHYIMPYNLVFRHTEREAWRMDDTMRKLVPLDVHEYFIEGKNHRLNKLRGTGWLTTGFRIEQWFSHINGRHFRVTKDCIVCGKCVSNCPTENITIQAERITFRNNCIHCMRCAFNCPQDAIRIGLLNKWRVNGPYHFRKPDKPEADKHAGFCRKSYERYYREAEERFYKYSSIFFADKGI